MAGFGAALDLPKTGLDLAAMAAPAGQPGTDAPQPGQPAEQGGEPAFGGKATPEEQDQKARFVGRALELVYSDNALPKIRDMLDGSGEGDDPVEGLAQATAMVVGRVAGAAEKSGIQLSPAVVLHAGTEVFEDLAHLSKVTGAKDYTQDQNAFHKAYYRAIDIYRTMLQGAGEVDQKSAQDDFGKMQEMDQKGQLDPMFRTLAQNDNQGGDQETPQETQAEPGEEPGEKPRGFGG